ncbi:MAG TPA: hypothetical protein VF187_09540 [Gemmatimonadales bacterium]
MEFRFKDGHGKIVQLADVAALGDAIREGLVTPDTPLAVGDDRVFKSAATIVAYQHAAIALGPRHSGIVPSPSRYTPDRGQSRSPGRYLLFLLLAAALLSGYLFFRSRSANGAPEPRPVMASAPAGPSPEMRASLTALVTEFADSFALAARGLEDWVAAQGFDQRLAGKDLRSGSSLRAVRSAAADYLARVDSLLVASERTAETLEARADSLEGVGGPRAGLLMATEDALAGWRRQLDHYAGLERAMAATIDSIAQFALARQQSFVVRDGQPVFLSRDDAARFRDLARALETHGQDESRWADGILQRHPEWMSAIAPADRPTFHRPMP